MQCFFTRGVWVFPHFFSIKTKPFFFEFFVYPFIKHKINMKAVITGASGLLGRSVTKQFQDAGWEGKTLM